MANENLPPELVLANFVTMKLAEEGLASSNTALMVCQKALAAIQPHLRTMLSAARAEGFAAAREQAAGIVRDMLEWQGSTSVGDRIRAMRDGAGEEPSPTARCRCGTVAREHEDSAPWACTASGCEGFRWQARP